MELLLGFVYDVFGIRAIRKEKNFASKIMMTFGFLILGFVLILVLLIL